MKRTFLIFLTCILSGTFFSSCNQDHEFMFDQNSQYIWFSLPFKVNQYGGITKERVDSLFYSFALDGPETDHYVFKIPVCVAGFAQNRDRVFNIEAVSSTTDVADEDWEKAILINPVIHKNQVFDTLSLRVNRTETLKNAYRHIHLRLLPNDEFQLSDSAYTEVKIAFTDILTPPSWWENWTRIFGTFCPETYLKWRELYPKGADPTANLYDSSQTYYYHCDNMPTSPNASWYPVLYMYLGLLQEYFNENEIYPYGDTSKPRIQIKL